MSIRLSLPDTAQAGEIIEIKTLIRHPMESGYRMDARGETIERDIITEFRCYYDQELVFSAEFNTGIAANPFLTFHTRALKSATLKFVWTDQHGENWSETAELKVS
jgi:sulfur-oxidizing protein SoxZ